MKPFRTFLYHMWALHKEEIEIECGTMPQYDFKTYWVRNEKFLKDVYRERIRTR